MRGLERTSQPSEPAGGTFVFLWRRKSWWLWPLAVLIVLIAIIYALAHLSAADSEMYPTTMRQECAPLTRC